MDRAKLLEAWEDQWRALDAYLTQPGVENRSLMDYAATRPESMRVLGSTWDGWNVVRVESQTGQTLTIPEPASFVQQAREEAAASERARLIAKVEALRPLDQPYTRRDWALEQRGESRMFDRILAALQGPDKKGE